MNLPNKLTLTRLVFVPIFVLIYMFPYQDFGIVFQSFRILGTHISVLDLILFIIFAGCSLTDFLDGYLARKNGMVTTFGKFVDPIADKLIVNTVILLLASSSRISIIIPIIMICRDTIVDAVRLLASQKNVVLSASLLGKAKTVTQMIAIILVLLNNIVFSSFGIPMDQIMMIVATIISIASGVEYFMKNKHYVMESM